MLLRYLAAGMIFLPAAAQAQQHDMQKEHAMEQHGASGWRELDSFHTLMAATWHPVAKSNDMKPIREKAGDLSAAAQAWAASKVPPACDTRKNRDAIAAVAAGSRDIAAMVSKNESDAAVKEALKNLHMRFEVVEGCKP